MATIAEARTLPRFTTAPLTPRIGAEICGIDLREELDDDTIADLRTALLIYKVIFFRAQDISEDQHIAFARRFGDLEVHPITPKDQPHPEIFHLKTRRTCPPAARSRPICGTATSPGAPSTRSARCCARGSCPTSAATPCSPIWPPPMRACRRR